MALKREHRGPLRGFGELQVATWGHWGHRPGCWSHLCGFGVLQHRLGCCVEPLCVGWGPYH